MLDTAPIGFTVYTRLDHLEKAIKYLKNNPLSEKSEIYFFSDGPRPGDEKKVAEVRKFLKGVSGFKDVNVIEREKNSRIKNNRGGQKFLLENYGKMIWLAEDILCAPGFLNFSNLALSKYKNCSGVQSISGYCPDIAPPPNYPYDGWFTNRFNAWGIGIWEKEYWQPPRYLDLSNYTSIANNRVAKRRFKDLIGEDALGMLYKETKHETDALDVRFMWYQFVNNRFTLRPYQSLTQNIGHDGSGLHCGVTDRFEVDLWGKVDGFELPDEPFLDQRWAEELAKFRKVSVKKKIRRKIGQSLRFFKRSSD